MRYTLTNEYVKLKETGGIIQNVSNDANIEISDNTDTQGLVLRPFALVTIEQAVYARKFSGNGTCTLAVLPFTTSASSGSTSGSGDSIGTSDGSSSTGTGYSTGGSSSSGAGAGSSGSSTSAVDYYHDLQRRRHSFPHQPPPPPYYRTFDPDPDGGYFDDRHPPHLPPPPPRPKHGDPNTVVIEIPRSELQRSNGRFYVDLHQRRDV